MGVYYNVPASRLSSTLHSHLTQARSREARIRVGSVELLEGLHELQIHVSKDAAFHSSLREALKALHREHTGEYRGLLASLGKYSSGVLVMLRHSDSAVLQDIRDALDEFTG